MKITYNWLKDFVEIKIPPQSLADKLTMAGMEVTSLEEKDRDFVLDIEVTSNRPDCLSVMGIAREVAAITGKKLKSLQASGFRLQAKNLQRAACSVQPFTIEIEDKRDCPLYTAKIIKDIKVAFSPGRLRKRLELIGCRSVNNIVDITNYILFELGEPLHAFDLDKLVTGLRPPVTGLRIIIRRANKGEEITTIDGIKRLLDENILIIASDNDSMTGYRRQATGRPIAIAGVMGGKDTEVTETTRNILLEAAIFDPLIVRRGRRNLGVQSDSSYRFERGIDAGIVDRASWQAVKLIEDSAGARCVVAKSSGRPKAEGKRIQLEISAVHKILGVNIAPSRIEKILKSLEFKINPVRNTKSPSKKLKISHGLKAKAKNHFIVGIPSHRADVNLEIDLIEEIARIVGYEFIPRHLPAVIPEVTAGKTEGLVPLIKNILAARGINEVITYSLTDKDLLRSFGIKPENGAVDIINPLSREQEVLRPKLIPSLARCIAYNLNQKQSYISIFEIAKVFSQTLTESREELVLGIGLCGTQSLLLTQGLVKEEAGFLHLKGILEALFGQLGIKEYNFNFADNGEASAYVHKDKIGRMVRLCKEILGHLGIKNKDVFAVELSLDILLPYINLNKKFTHLPVYPGILRDISFILQDNILAAEVLEAIKEKGRPLLQEVKIVDYYKGTQIPPGFKGLTVSCLYRAAERTLTEAEIAPLHSEISLTLAGRFNVQIR